MKAATPMMTLMATATVDRSQIAPTVSPEGPHDPWTCATATWEQFFYYYGNVPSMGTKLAEAVGSYGASLRSETCLHPPRTEGPCADLVEETRYCEVTKALPTSLLPAYSSFGSSAASWWAQHSSSAVSLARDCPHRWYKEAVQHYMFGGRMLNDTINWAECYVEAHSNEKFTVVTGTGSSTRAASTTNIVYFGEGRPRSSSRAVWDLGSTSSTGSPTGISTGSSISSDSVTPKSSGSGANGRSEGLPLVIKTSFLSSISCDVSLDDEMLEEQMIHAA